MADAIGIATGLPMAAMNGVWATSADVDVEAVRAVLDRLVDAGNPHCLQFPNSHQGPAALAVERDMGFEEDIPLMGVAGPSRAPGRPGLAFRELAADEVMAHAGLARGFEAPVEMFQALTALVAGTEGVRFYTAITAHVVRDGLAAGAWSAWLQSSPDGFGIYQKLGFKVVATWQCWSAR